MTWQRVGSFKSLSVKVNNLGRYVRATSSCLNEPLETVRNYHPDESISDLQKL